MKFTYLLIATLFPAVLMAQCWSSGTGADGAYHATDTTTIVGGTYNFTSFTIDPDVLVNVTGNQPLIVYCTGAVSIAGTLTASGQNGTDGITYSAGGTGGVGVAGGSNGGNGAFSSSTGPLDGSAGANTGGGGQGSGWSGGGGAGYASVGDSSHGVGGFGGPVYGTADLGGLWSGSGGGGGSGGYDCGAGGGGAGGGVIVFYAQSITILGGGAILSNGGNGGSDGSGNCGGGGGGSGGAILLSAYTVSNDGTISAAGGLGGSSQVSGSPYYGTGGNGSDGRIRIDYNGTLAGNGTVSPASGYTSTMFAVTAQSLSPACSGTDNGQASLTVSGGTSPYTYSWTQSGEITSTATQLPAGTNTFVVTDANMCTYTGTVDVDSIGPFASTQTLSICNGESVTVGSSVYTTSGTYTDVLTSVQGCDSTVTTNLTVSTVNVSVVNSGGTLTAQATGSTYQWVDCDNGYAAISGATDAAYQPVSAGNYAVIVTTNSCSDTSACQTFSNLGITDNLLENVSVYPNPTMGSLTVNLGADLTLDRLFVTDLSGKIIYSQGQSASSFVIDLSNQSSGVYFLNLQSGAGTKVLKITRK